MATRSALTSLPVRLCAPFSAAATGSVCLFSDGKGRVLSKEERAKETVYIQKMEERQEKLKKRLEQEKSAADKKAEGST